MTTYNTGNPLGSKDPRDLYDNAENLDAAVNTRQAESWDDRFGVARKTWWGMEQEFNADQDDREDRFSAFLASSGYQQLGDYAAGLEITEYNQIFRHEGGWWRAAATTELPYTTTGDWGTEKDNFLSLGEAYISFGESTLQNYVSVLSEYSPVGEFGDNVVATGGGRSVARDGLGLWWWYIGENDITLTDIVTPDSDWSCLGVLDGKHKKESIENFIVSGTDITMALDRAITSPYDELILMEGVNIYNGELLIDRSDFVIKGAGQGKTILECVRVRWGNLPPDQTYADNMPKFDGNKRYFNEQWCSPSQPGFPRRKNVGFDELTIKVTTPSANQLVNIIRCDGVVVNFDLTFDGNPFAYDAVQFYFCSDIKVKTLKTKGSNQFVYNVFFYWCFDVDVSLIEAGTVSSDPASQSLEFKHVVNLNATTLRSSGRTTVGYKSLNVNVGTLEVDGGLLSLTASEPFDFTRDINIDRLTINNPSGGGIIISRIENLSIAYAEITARNILYFAPGDFLVGSSRLGEKTIPNSGMYVYDGEYDRSEVSGGFTKYIETRQWESAKNVIIGMLIARISDGGGLIVTNTPYNTFQDMFSGNGRVKRFAGIRSSNIDEIENRVDTPNVVGRPVAAINGLNINAEIHNLSSENIDVVRMYSPVIYSSINIVNGSTSLRNGTGGILFDTEISIQSTNSLPKNALEPYVLSRSKIHLIQGNNTGTNGAVLLNTPVYSTEPITGVELSGVLTYSTNPAGNPIIAINTPSGNAGAWVERNPIALNDLRIVISDGSDYSGVFLYHKASVPPGLTSTIGLSKIDVRGNSGVILEGYFSNRQPQHVGQITQDRTTGDLYIAKSLGVSGWYKLTT